MLGPNYATQPGISDFLQAESSLVPHAPLLFFMSLLHDQNEELNQSFIPVMVVTHSFRRVLMSVRSQAPANAGAGRGVNVGKASASGFEVDAEGWFSVWG